MILVPLSELIKPAGERTGNNTDLPVYSVTKHAGFVPSLEYFKKQVFSRDLEGYKLVEPGDFAYATIHLDEGSIGIAPERGLISPMYTIFRTDDDRVSSEYLLRFLKSPQALAQYPRLGRGAVHRRMSISLAALGTLEVPLPPLSEQRRVAAILDQADTLRARRRQVLAHFDALTRSIFHDMFGQLQPDATVAEAAINIRTGPFGSQLLHSEFVDQGISVLGLDNVVANEFTWGQRRYITPTKYEQLRRYTVAPGDVLISIMGTTGRCVVVPKGIPTAINTKHICAITPDKERLDSTFLWAAFLWHPSARKYLRRQTKGSIMEGLNMGIIKGMPIPVPALSDQRAFTEKIERIVVQRRLTEKVADSQDALFASLQSRAFRGEL